MVDCCWLFVFDFWYFGLFGWCVCLLLISSWIFCLLLGGGRLVECLFVITCVCCLIVADLFFSVLLIELMWVVIGFALAAVAFELMLVIGFVVYFSCVWDLHCLLLCLVDLCVVLFFVCLFDYVKFVGF